MRSIASLLFAGVLVAVLAALFAPSHAWGGRAKRSAALVSYGASDELEDDVRTALGTLQSIALKDKKSTQADVAAAAELGTSCPPSSMDCLASLAVLLRVDVLVVSSLEQEALEMFAIDSALGRESARERAPMPASSGRQQVRDIARDLVQLLLEPHLHYGTIVVNAPPSSSITVDGAAAVGPTRLRAGSHRVVVELAHHEPFSTDVEVTAGREVVVNAELRAAAGSDARAPSAAGGGGGGGAGSPSEASGPGGAWIMAASGAGVAVLGGAFALGIDAGLGAGLGSADEKEGYQAIGVVALVVASTGAAVAITGAAIALLAED